jgi:hypothetical protein
VDSFQPAMAMYLFRFKPVHLRRLVLLLRIPSVRRSNRSVVHPEEALMLFLHRLAFPGTAVVPGLPPCLLLTVNTNPHARVCVASSHSPQPSALPPLPLPRSPRQLSRRHQDHCHQQSPRTEPWRPKHRVCGSASGHAVTS